ncbi:hypothetical protein ACE939_00865 [Aquimarina sp. W85]|uniref:hypothetical protein n=1 Tax=Aquimarina rhodophyticola TaxID=3342246 RepID=UPI00366F18F5
MATTKNDVIDYLKNDRSLTGGKNLYNKMIGKSLAVQNSFNRMINSRENLAKMYYEIGRVVGITEREILIYTSQPIKSITGKKVIKLTPVKKSLDDLILAFNPNKKIAYHELKKFASRLAEEKKVEFKNQKASTLSDGILATASKIRIEQLTHAPAEVKNTIRLYEQFPFLRWKNCPDVFKILVANMITAYSEYRAAHSSLFEKAKQEELAAIAATVKDNYIENKLIWDELEYYQENQQILGKHEIFTKQNLATEISEISTEELSKKISNIKTNVSRNKKKATDKQRSDADREKSQELLEKYELELTVAEQELAKR